MGLASGRAFRSDPVMTLPISARVARLRAGTDDTLLLRLPSGFAVLNQNQPPAVRGACLLVPDPVVGGVHDLLPAARVQFFLDLSLLGDAVHAAVSAERVNYLVLCNVVPELHGHCVPRFATEDPESRRRGPFEAYDFGRAPATDVRGADRELRDRIRAELARLCAARG